MIPDPGPMKLFPPDPGSGKFVTPRDRMHSENCRAEFAFVLAAPPEDPQAANTAPQVAVRIVGGRTLQDSVRIAAYSRHRR